MIAHEINQPLMIITTVLDRIRRQNSSSTLDPAELPNLLDTADQAIERASDVIKHMRSYSYQDADIPDNGWLEPIPIIEQALKFFHALCTHEQIELKLDIPDSLNAPHYRIWGEQRQLEQLLVNLTNNAIHAIQERRKKEPEESYSITIRCFIESSRQEPQLRIDIEDNGIGMSSDQRLRCMEPFYTTRSVGEGTGLGLFIVKGIIRRFHATIDFQSKLRKGTQVHVGFRLSC